MGATVKSRQRLISEKQVSSNGRKVEVTAESKGKSGRWQKPIPTEKRNSLNQHPNQVTSKFYKNPFFAEDLKILDFTIGFTRNFFLREKIQVDKIKRSKNGNKSF